MTDKVRNVVLFVAMLVVLGLANIQIAGKEAIIRDGRTVLLRLAPIDPRSLMQGDYMALRYAIENDVASAATGAGMSDGTAIVRLGDLGEASFIALNDGRQLEPDEALIRFRKRGDTVRLASDAYFFEEGLFETFGSARFGELRVDSDGEAVLTGLRAEDGARLGEPLHDID